MRLAWLVLLGAANVFFACGGDDPPAAAPDDAGPVVPPDAAADADAGVVPKGSRVLGMDVAPASLRYPTNVAAARDAGATVANATFAWDDIEVTTDGGTEIGNAGLHIVNLVLDGYSTSVSLAIDAVDVGGTRAPQDLAARAWDDPEVATRFERVIDYAYDQMPDVRIATLYVGADVDVALGDDPSAYSAFATFVGRVAAHAKTTRSPAPRVGVVASAAGLSSKKPLLAPLFASGDVVGVSYFHVGPDARVRPVAEVREALARIAADAPPGLALELREVGVPRAAECGGDPSLQADFVRAVFAAWDEHADRLTQITFFEWEDAPEPTARAVAARAGRGNDATFLAMLQSLGIAGHPAEAVLRAEARARGF